MTSRFAGESRRWLKAVTTTAAASALVLGGGIATATVGHASGEHDGHGGGDASGQHDGGHDGGHGGGHDGHEGGDACEFFLEHMWANEDGIPLLGSFAHVNEYHTDPDYENLVLSLASGAIGNSEMPIIDIYGGPLGWIPVFNPSHVKGHNTDYVTLLTSCGGIGIPLDSNDLTTLDVPSADELADLSDLIVPGLPSPEMITDPDYLWETTDASAILDRVTPETLLNLEEYVGFAGDHFDTWRLLWETALDDVTSGNPTGTLELLQITENINTLESLADVVGEDALGDLLGEDDLGGLLDAGDLESVLELDGLLDESGLGGVLDQGGLDGLLELEGVLDEGGLDGILDGGGLDGVLDEGGLDGILDEGGLDGLLELEGLLDEGGLDGILDGLLGGGDSGGLLGGGGLGGLLGGGGDSGDVSTETKYTVLLSGTESSGLGQCQGTLTDNTLTVNCLYADTTSEVTSVTLQTAGSDLELTATGGTSGAAGGSFELTSEQVAALQAGESTLTVSTTGYAEGEISGSVELCCD
ncbi:hypothetical protein [Nesterenkonia xinjiangensis]|uniref:Uncharacterized protein n=1 Tax=Nesterenkonia xinjiangensis TaxID=225327 RepID=A0A7Z0GLF7_9MICC|nr:hypothetical protein [Nesterenkonia xinjiangensis]NYJ78182.1 hypothetical protein [Nesterenkonia xinjiangensis]